MGLDIYVYHYTTDPARVHAIEDQYNERCEALYADDAPPADVRGDEDRTRAWRDGERARIAAELGLVGGEYSAEHPGKVRLDAPSRFAPENINRVGYFRSSYNDGGINRVIPRVTGEDKGYGYIFGNEDAAYHFAPDWRRTRERALEVLGLLEAANARGQGHGVMEVAPNPFGDWTREAGATSEHEALELFLTKHLSGLKRPDPFGDGGGYSDLTGEYFRAPLKVRALIRGGLQRKGYGAPVPVLYAVYESEHGAVHPSYLDSLKVVVETCDHVLAQPDPERWLLHWSG